MLTDAECRNVVSSYSEPQADLWLSSISERLARLGQVLQCGEPGADYRFIEVCEL